MYKSVLVIVIDVPLETPHTSNHKLSTNQKKMEGRKTFSMLCNAYPW